MSTEEATREIKKLIGNARVFGAEFVTRKGEVRKGCFRLGVRRGLTGAGPSYNTDAYGNIIAFDMMKLDYRTIPLRRLIRLKVRGKEVQGPLA